MNFKPFLIVGASVLAVGVGVSLLNDKPEETIANMVIKPPTQEQVYLEGEVIRYEIKKLRMDVGDATLTIHGATTIDGVDALLITFVSEGFKFFDEEKIYLDPETFLPIRVSRNIDVFGKKELIEEYYDQQKGSVRIVKNAKGEVTEQTIEKGGPIENIYGFIYRYRQQGRFQEGESLSLRLPTKEVQMQFKNKDEVKINKEKRDAYYLESDPKEYKVWFSTDSLRIPLRIDGAIGFGKTAMIMKEYNK